MQMVGLTMSCDSTRLKQIMALGSNMMKGYWGLTREDKEDILLDVAYRFEADNGRFPNSVYARHCHNKIVGFLQKKTAQKRMLREVTPEGKIRYIPDMSLNVLLDSESDTEIGDLIPVEDKRLEESEYFMDLERAVPELAPLLKKVLGGQKLELKDKNMLKKYLKKDVIID